MPRLDLPADGHQRKVLITGVGRGGDAAGQHAGGGAQQHAQWAAEHPDQHADQATACDGDAGGDVIALGHPHDSVGSALQQRCRPNLQLPRVTCLPQPAQRLVGAALLGDPDQHDVVIHSNSLSVC